MSMYGAMRSLKLQLRDSKVVNILQGFYLLENLKLLLFLLFVIFVYW